jgi:hypothetical protein
MYRAEFAPAANPDTLWEGLVPPLPKRPSAITGYVSAIISLGLLAAVLFQMRGLAIGKIWAMVPVSAGFWLAYLAYYLAAPLSEWWIYHRLWQLPVDALAALLRKLVSNELLLGYLGEVQFYAWARRRTAMTTAPFGAIKDVTILSALTGNVVTLVMLILAWPLLTTTQIGLEMRTAFVSLGVVLITSILILVFRRKLFSLPAAELYMVAGVHIARIGVILALSALMWHIVLPDVPIGWWLLLATLRMLISRLPLVPNKDVVFAALAVFLLGHDVQIADLLTMMAGIILVTHLFVGAVLGAADLLQWQRQS